MRLKKFIMVSLAAVMLMSCAACSKKEEVTEATTEVVTEAPTEEEASSNDSLATEMDAADDVADKGGDGLVSDEMVQKGYVYMSDVNESTFDMTYDDVAAYFGADGLFDKEEYSDHMEANYRYYKWISKDNDSVFIYVNFKQDDDGVYRVSGYNSSGFTLDEARDKYLDELQSESGSGSEE